MDVSAVQTVDKPTRDVLVVYDSDGDRQFVGFGGPNDSFADCYISADQLPLDTLTKCAALVTGTLGLAFPSTAAAMYKAVEAARTGPAVVSHTGPASMHCKCSMIISPTANYASAVSGQSDRAQDTGCLVSETEMACRHFPQVCELQAGCAGAG